MSFTVAILGRPNVGKSTLFNRLVGRQLALVDDLPGVTRDRREGEGHIADLAFRLIDTAGLEEAPPETLAGRIRAQTERSLDLADVALLVIDAREGVTPDDRHFARWLRRTGEAGHPRRQQGRKPRRARRVGRGPWPRARRAGGDLGAARRGARRAVRAALAVRGARGERRSGQPARGPIGKAAAACHCRPAQCRQVDAGQSPDRRGPGADRPRARHHPRRDRGRLGLGRAADSARRHRRDAPPGAHRSAARAAVGRRCAARRALCRNRHSRHRRAAAAGASGSDDRQSGRRGRAGARAGRQ